MRAGDIKEFSYSNAELSLQGTFSVKASEGNTLDPGGVRTNDDANQITTTGEPIWQQNMKMGGANIVIANNMALNTHDVCVQLAGAQTDTVFTITSINNKTYQGSGMLVGDIVPNLNDSTLSIKVACPNLKPI